MSKPKWLREIENQAGEKPVLLVEGNTDIRVIAYFLRQVSTTWNTEIVLLPAQRKSQVIRAISDYHPEWGGIVDRDEWSPQQIRDSLTNPRVKVLPRFCLENFFCIPTELWEAVPSWLKNTKSDSFSQLERSVLDSLPDWVAHGAMWRVIRNRRTGLLYESDFPSRLEREPVIDLDEIRTILSEWHEQLDPDQVIAEYQEELNKVNHDFEPKTQLQVYIHGKKFYRQVIVPTLNNIFQPTDADTWLERFTNETDGLSISGDLHNFLTDILRLFD